MKSDKIYIAFRTAACKEIFEIALLGAAKPASEERQYSKDMPAMSETRKPGLLQKLAMLKDHKKELFWVWVAYQTVKGMMTTSLIWIPLLYALKNFG
ncbi:hypothetical protein [Sphingopyxis sp.]|uniref:hypothetical protein n=1 Tax=Sphingopyxis sp. TaxID=1908224 RepID=UPI001DF6472E|nr:hypothetical protein [Sphingopyxis sp.]MBW8294493.1 hypothetical protein [Sphingopyxis sp.]